MNFNFKLKRSNFESVKNKYLPFLTACAEVLKRDILILSPDGEMLHAISGRMTPPGNNEELPPVGKHPPFVLAYDSEKSHLEVDKKTGKQVYVVSKPGHYQSVWPDPSCQDLLEPLTLEKIEQWKKKLQEHAQNKKGQQSKPKLQQKVQQHPHPVQPETPADLEAQKSLVSEKHSTDKGQRPTPKFKFKKTPLLQPENVPR